MSKASDKRYAALKTVGASIVTYEASEGMNVWHITDRTEAATLIRTLAPLGRTERWLARIEQWARMVEDEDNPYEWAVYQGSIYASYAAE